MKAVMHVVDLRGVMCPMNFVRAKLALEEFETGDLIEFRIDDGEPVKNLPRSLKGEGHKLLGLIEINEYYILTIEKAEG